jgi:redox-sensitive bicupin YhaK (pirin superfamily)
VTSPERTTLVIVLKGSVDVAGKSLTQRDAIRLDPGDAMTLTSTEGGELSLYGLSV